MNAAETVEFGASWASAEERLIRLASERLGFERSRLFVGRIADAMGAARHALGSASPDRAVDALAVLPLDSAAWQAAIAHLTVNETRFHRDRPWFDAVERHVIAPLIAERAARGERRIAIWSAGCATGEEPYTLAMLADRLLPPGEDWDVRVMATDINRKNLATARQGTFGPWALRELDIDLGARYFTRAGKMHKVAPGIAGRVTFLPLNLVEPAYPDAAQGLAGFDIILCRNTLMYWMADQQQAVIARLRRSLAPGGWLIVSAAEAGIPELYRMERVRIDGAIFFRDRPESARPEPARQEPPAPAPVRTVATPRRPARPLYAKPLAPLPAAGSAPPTIAGSARPTATESVNPPAPLSGSAESGLAQVRGLADGGQLGEARAACMALLREDALDLETNLLLAMICEEQGDFGAALAAARRAIYLAPDQPIGHFLAGTAAHRMGRAEEAGRSMRALLGTLDRGGAKAADPLGLELSETEMRRTAFSILGLLDFGRGGAGP